MVDALGFISGTGAIINPYVILTSAQHFEGYVQWNRDKIFLNC